MSLGGKKLKKARSKHKPISYIARSKCRQLSEFGEKRQGDVLSTHNRFPPSDCFSPVSHHNLEELYPGIKEYCKKHDCSFKEAIKHYEVLG